MDSVRSPEQRASPRHAATVAHVPVPVKIVVAGGFAVGKSTAVGAISEIARLTTEVAMTPTAAGADESDAANGRATITVAMDVGCVPIDDDLKLYLFGAPGQSRLGAMWDDLARGALGGLVVADSGRLDDCFPAVDYFERVGLPFAVGVNAFHGQLTQDVDAVRGALAIDPGIPVFGFDARNRLSVRDALLIVLDRALAGTSAALAGGVR